MNKGRLVRKDNKKVNLAVLVYPAPPNGDPNQRSVYLMDAMVHPQDERAQGRSDLSLDVKPDIRAPQGKNRFTVCTEEEVDSLNKAAGENQVSVPLSRGSNGYVFGVTADLRSSNFAGTPGSQSVYMESLQPSELPVTPDAQGKSILVQIGEFNDAAGHTQAKAAYDKANAQRKTRAETLDTPGVSADHDREGAL